MFNNNLSLDSKVWIYQSDRFFTEEEVKIIRPMVKEFAAQWSSHKIGVAGDGDLLYSLFVVLMADESVTGVSGCSIDSSVGFIRSLQKRFGVSFFSRTNIAYSANEIVQLSSLSNFRMQLTNGTLSDDTLVFDNLIQTKSELLDCWRLPYSKSSWRKIEAIPEPIFTL